MRRFVKLKTTQRNDLTVHTSRTLLEQKQLEPERLSALFPPCKARGRTGARRSPLSFHSASLRARHPRLSIVGSSKKPHTAFTATCATGLHVLCQSQPRRVLSKISQLNWFANREQRPPFNQNCEDCQALRRPGLRGSVNLAQRWEFPFAWKWCPSNVISLSQPRIRQGLSIIGTAFLRLVAEHRSVPLLPLRFLDRSGILIRVASFWGDVIQVVPRVLESDSHSLRHCHQLGLVLAARQCQEEELQIQHLSPAR